MIFRPRPNDDKSFTKNGQVFTPSNGISDNILELNLTLEQLTFGPSLGGIPNRGLFEQSTIT
jgi:hypothetical protein